MKRVLDLDGDEYEARGQKAKRPKEEIRTILEIEFRETWLLCYQKKASYVIPDSYALELLLLLTRSAGS